jgi:lipopolysaccharide/colanic/teichoic acid biosynthesis glycosyltransferase
MIITAIAIKIDSPGPVLFRQKRIGYKGKVFEIYKFRSMCQGAEHTGTGVYSGADDMRVTRVGKIHKSLAYFILK